MTAAGQVYGKRRWLGLGWIPIITGLTWIGGLLALIGIWGASGTPHYKSNQGNIAYISDIAAVQQPMFIAITSVTAAGYVVSLCIDRYYRHVGRLMPENRRRERWLGALSILFAIGGGAALILLACFNDINYSNIHWSMTLVFVVCIAISAIFHTAEIGWLRKDAPGFKYLRYSYMVKIAIVIVAVGTAIAMGVLMALKYVSPAAVCEWTIAILFDAYIFSLAYDLWPAVAHSRGFGKHREPATPLHERNNNV